MAGCLTPCGRHPRIGLAKPRLTALHHHADARGSSFDAALGQELQRINTFYLEQEGRAEVRPGAKSCLTGVVQGSVAQQAVAILPASSQSRTEVNKSG